MTTYEAACDNCDASSKFADDNSPVEEIAILYFEGGWKLGSTTLCPDCAKPAVPK